MPVYLVKNTSGYARLVRAPNIAQAIRHVAKGEFTAAAASVDEVIDLMQAGTRVETAGAEQAPSGFDPDAFVADPADLAAVNAAVGTTLPIEGA